MNHIQSLLHRVRVALFGPEPRTAKSLVGERLTHAMTGGLPREVIDYEIGEVRGHMIVILHLADGPEVVPHQAADEALLTT